MELTRIEMMTTKSVSAAISMNVFNNIHRDDIKIMSKTACGWCLIWLVLYVVAFRLRYGAKLGD